MSWYASSPSKVVAGVDGTPKGWAVVIMEAGGSVVERIDALSDLFGDGRDYAIVAIDVPIGLLDSCEAGGRARDRAARKLLGSPRGSSVFPAPVRPVLAATSWEDACARSRASAPYGTAISKQTYSILDKIREVDKLLHARRELRDVVYEIHPEVSFCELAGKPMAYRKASLAGRSERQRELARYFQNLDQLEEEGRRQELPIEDILDATVACWSARRIINGEGRSLLDPIPRDSAGLDMTIWV
jgi:predicted RNase H-like nuclease